MTRARAERLYLIWIFVLAVTATALFVDSLVEGW